jgi:transposase
MAILRGDEDMGRPYGDDLRRKFLSAYDAGEGTLEELAERFLVSVGWAKKISAQRNRTGHAERVPHRAGRKPHAGPEAQQQVRSWIAAKPDLTLAEIQGKLRSQATVRLSIPQIWRLLRRMGLRLKKSRSMPANATAKSIASGVPNSRRKSARSRRSD